LLASIALCVATTILMKMHGAKFMWITCAPLVWLLSATFTAAWQKIFSPIPAIGFLAQADKLAAGPQTAVTQTLIFNARLDAVICGVLLALVATILADSTRIWFGILRGTRPAQAHEAPFVLSQLRAEEL
jgi:carbon starvation protein